jgi:predicted AAA+ superfamily ATPase
MADLKTWRTRKDRKPLILRGARQVGKTWLPKYFGEKSIRFKKAFDLRS